MLRSLSVSDLALIEDVELELGPGLNVVSGETGAGKSLLQQALAIALGLKVGAEVIREGRGEARVEAHFAWPDGASEVRSTLAERGVPLGDDLRIQRTIVRGGRGQILVNERSVPQAVLVELGAVLAQLQGQHESLRLLRAEAHLEILDAAAGTEPLAQKFREQYARVSGLIERLEAILRGTAELERRLEIARFDLDELGKASLTDPDEETKLHAERSRLRNAERLGRAAGEALAHLHSDDGAALAAVEKHARALSELQDVDPRLRPAAEGLELAASPLADAVRELQEYVDSLEADPHRLEEIEDRLALIARLVRKHGVTDLAGLIAKHEDLAAQVEHAARDAANPDALRAELDDAANEAWRLADELTAKRKAGATRLETRMREELASLGMAEARFSVAFESLAPGIQRGAAEVLVRDGRGLGPDGPLRVEFHLAANPGEGERPLARVASGGELSRLMLALGSVAGSGAVPTLVFDEVDAGIGGATAEVVGRRLRDLGRRHQVLCITHLGQIAAFADRHYVVEKKRAGGRTRSAVITVEGEERVRELARMLGATGEPALQHAREMIRRADGDPRESASRTAKAQGRARVARRGA